MVVARGRELGLVTRCCRCRVPRQSPPPPQPFSKGVGCFGRGSRSSRIDRDEQDARAAAGLGRRRHETLSPEGGRAGKKREETAGAN